MQLNFDEEAYKRLCRIADYYGTTPAWLARQWVMEKLSFEEVLISRRHRVGSQGRDDGPNPDSQPHGPLK
jgi:hypothetical protein